jgi:formiminoglutamate deiminase
MGAFWCELAWLGGDDVDAGVLVETDGERIKRLDAGVGAPPGAIRLRGLVLPGLANAHSHAFQRALRGRTHLGQGSFWTWREQMYELAESLDPDSYMRLATATFGEMALAGITTVGEFHYIHHDRGGRRYSEPNAMGEALTEAARRAGIRITLIDACYLHGGIDAELEGAQLRFSDGDVDGWAERVSQLEEGPRARLGAAIHSVRAVDPESAGAVSVWAARRGAPLHAHVSEQPTENEDCVAAYGSTPVGVLADAGALGERFVAVHGTHLADADIEVLATARCACCLCPTTERDLADGVGPARRLADAGVRLSLGSDSNALIDMLEEARAVELDERLSTGVRGNHHPSELLAAATASGHACLGWPEAGRLEPGALCDLVAVRLDTPRLAGMDPRSAMSGLVFAGGTPDVGDVIVGARHIVREGLHVDLDVPSELRTSIEALAA